MTLRRDKYEWGILTDLDQHMTNQGKMAKHKKAEQKIHSRFSRPGNCYAKVYLTGRHDNPKRPHEGTELRKCTTNRNM